jgi:hypothetical protein
MQAIQTRYIGFRNVRGSRVKAFAQAGSVTLTWDDALSEYANHVLAAEALCERLGWTGKMYGTLASGVLKNGDHVHVLSY